MEEKKICVICKEEKLISEFSKKNKTKDGTQKYASICKKCFNEKDAKRRATNEYKEKKIKYDSKYYNENQEEILKRKKEYHIENREKILQEKKKYRNIPEIKEKNRLYIKDYAKNNKEKYYKYRRDNSHIVAWRQLLYRTLYYLNTTKEGHTQDMLGYSAVELKHHIESRFKEGMSWSNYGEWEIDHIRPLTSFNESNDPSEVNALSNLQPLWKEENIAKYNHY
jgi:hypothetical protein